MRVQDNIKTTGNHRSYASTARYISSGILPVKSLSLLLSGILVLLSITAYPAAAKGTNDVPGLAGSTITAPSISNFCMSGNPGVITGSDPSGGDGVYTFQWQSSSDGINFYDISGATLKDYKPEILTETVYFRRRITSGSSVLISNRIVINITQAIEDNTINAPALGDCSRRDAGVIMGNVPSNGKDYKYQWQISTVGTSNTFTDIAGATAKDYDPKSISKTTYYRRQVSSGACTFSSNIVKLTVQPDIPDNTISAPAISTFCGSGDPAVINGSHPQGGTAGLTYMWQSSTDATGGFTYIKGATAMDYNPGLITRTTYFRREVISGSCSYFTGIVKLTVVPGLSNNTVLSPQTIISGSKPVALIGSVPAGGRGSAYTYLWESSTESDTTGFMPAAGDNSGQNYNPGILIQTTFFRRRVISGSCAILNSNVVAITVVSPNHPPVAVADNFPAVENTALLIRSSELLHNDSDPDNDHLTISAFTQPRHGTLTQAAGGDFTYMPLGSFTGADKFEYGITDGKLSDTAVVTITVMGKPVLGIAKMLTGSVLQGDGTYNVSFKIFVHNMGRADLHDLRITDDLAGAFPAPLTVKVIAAPAAEGAGLTVNSGYDGRQDKNLLGKGSMLQAGSDAVIRFSVNVNINGRPGKFFSMAAATATGNGTTVSDSSAAGDDPDPDGNGNPEENEPIVITLEGNPVIGISKAVSAPLRLSDKNNTNVLTYKITVKNYGNVPLSNIELKDDLTKAFPFPARFSIDKAPSSAKGILIPDLAFNGDGNINLLRSGKYFSNDHVMKVSSAVAYNSYSRESASAREGNNAVTASFYSEGLDGMPGTLAVGQSDTITFTIRVIPGYTMGPFNNLATAGAAGPAGQITSDVSVEGTDPDPNHDGNPDESKATPVTLQKENMKVPEGFSPNGDGINDVLVIENFDNKPISLEVHNSVGKLVYRSANYRNDWTGICNQGSVGEPIPNGNYFLVIAKPGSDKYISAFTINR